MNFLEALLDAIRGGRYDGGTTAPGWRGTGTRMRKSRTPYQGRSRRETPALSMTIESFRDKEKRDERFKELRAAGKRNVTKFSDCEYGVTVWYVARGR